MGQLPDDDALRLRAEQALGRLGAPPLSAAAGGGLAVRTPITGAVIGAVAAATAPDVAAAVGRAQEAFAIWREWPAPRRGLLVRALADLLRTHQGDLADLVTLEAGKIRSEALGEVQEMIDVADFAVGLSRQLHGLTIASERPGHRMMETWHPLGVVGVVTAFNFPVAVWAWNAALALVCGDPVVWKPSEQTPLCALGAQALLRRAAETVGAPADVSQVVLGGADVGAALVDSPHVALVSATGSTAMGRVVGPRVAARFGRTLLELGGNNGAIVAPTADLELTARAVVFAAAGTAGQRCTTLRRLIVHTSVRDELLGRLGRAYSSLPVGDPFAPGTLVGPLVSAAAYERLSGALVEARTDGGEVVVGGERLLAEDAPRAWYVRPAVIAMPAQTAVVRRETFGPLLYVLEYDDFDAALAVHNDVPQGLASAVFTRDLREAERFIARSDCGIANVNIGPSGAEIGGAFGGEKETGGGRESGSDSWRAYMRRATNTVNYSEDLPLAQGVRFG